MPEGKNESLVLIGTLIARCTFFSSEWLDPEQVKVAETAPNEFVVKCGKMLSEQEIRGAIVKFKLLQQQDKPMRRSTLALDEQFLRNSSLAVLDEHNPEDEDDDFIDQDELAERMEEDEDDPDDFDNLDDEDEDADTFDEDLEQEFVDRDEEDEPDEVDYEEGLLGEDDD